MSALPYRHIRINSLLFYSESNKYRILFTEPKQYKSINPKEGEKMKKETYEKPTIKTEKIKLGSFGDYDACGPNENGKGQPLEHLCCY